MKKILLIVVFLGLALNYVHAQMVSENDLPAPVLKKFHKLYPDVKKRADWSNKDDNYKAEFLVLKAHYSVTLSEKGDIIEKREAVAVATLPPTVPPYMSKNHKGFKLKESYKVTDEKKNVTYEVHAKGNLLRKWFVFLMRKENTLRMVNLRPLHLLTPINNHLKIANIKGSL